MTIILICANATSPVKAGSPAIFLCGALNAAHLPFEPNGSGWMTVYVLALVIGVGGGALHRLFFGALQVGAA